MLRVSAPFNNQQAAAVEWGGPGESEPAQSRLPDHEKGPATKNKAPVNVPAQKDRMKQMKLMQNISSKYSFSEIIQNFI